MIQIYILNLYRYGSGRTIWDPINSGKGKSECELELTGLLTVFLTKCNANFSKCLNIYFPSFAYMYFM